MRHPLLVIAAFSTLLVAHIVTVLSIVSHAAPMHSGFHLSAPSGISQL